MSKYKIDRDLKFLKHYHPTSNKAFLKIGNFGLKVLPKGFDKTKVDIQELNVGETKIRIITPIELSNETLPLLFYIHGGGFMYESSFVQFKNEQEYALKSKCKILDIEYHLSPQYPYPYAINECFDVYKYVLGNSEQLHLDIDNVIIGGDSAGGSLANDLYLKIVSSKVKEPKGIFLIYPVVDNLQNTESMKKYIDTPGWDSKNNKIMWDYYLQGKEYLSPLTKLDMYDIDFMYIEVCEFDCLHDEGVNLYKGLVGKVNHLILNDTKGTFHGYDFNRYSNVVKTNMKKRIQFLLNVFEYKE